MFMKWYDYPFDLGRWYNLAYGVVLVYLPTNS